MVAPFETAQELTVTLNIGTNEQESQTVTRSLAVGKMGIIDFLLGDDIPACTQALFTVSAEGKKVCFSPGNLQRRGSLISWQLRFAPNQWDAGTKVSYMEDASWNIVPTDENAWYGLFSWGTGDRATSYVSVSSESYVDWGINPIQLGNTSKTYKSGYWRVLNSNEGAFLLSNPVRGEARFVDCMVHGVYGVVIFPDHYDLSHPLLLGRQLNTSNTIGTANFWQITNNEWDIMEKEGCVFLPITGWYSFTGGSSPDLYQEENEGFYFCRTRPSGYYTFGYVDRPTHGTKHGSGSQCAVRMVHNAVGF